MFTSLADCSSYLLKEVASRAYCEAYASESCRVFYLKDSQLKKVSDIMITELSYIDVGNERSELLERASV